MIDPEEAFLLGFSNAIVTAEEYIAECDKNGVGQPEEIEGMYSITNELRRIWVEKVERKEKRKEEDAN